MEKTVDGEYQNFKQKGGAYTRENFFNKFPETAKLVDVAFNHFFKAPNEKDGGDLIFFQGHISPGIYARSFLEGRFTQEQMDNFRQEAFADGLSSYPHPKLMPTYCNFLQFLWVLDLYKQFIKQDS